MINCFCPSTLEMEFAATPASKHEPSHRLLQPPGFGASGTLSGSSPGLPTSHLEGWEEGRGQPDMDPPGLEVCCSPSDLGGWLQASFLGIALSTWNTWSI